MTIGTITKTMLAVAVGILLLSVHTAYAQTATVTAQGGPDYGSGFLRWDTFSCDLSASFDKTPTPNQEATLNSDTPTWSWSSSGSGFQLTGDQTSDHVTLVGNPNPSKSNTLNAGKNSITVTATAHWTDNKGGSYSSSAGSVTVTFFVRIPVDAYERGETPENDDNGWTDTFNMQIRDNQSSPQTYNNGIPLEQFSGDTTTSHAPATTWYLNPDGTGNPNGEFEDKFQAVYPLGFDPTVSTTTPHGSFNQTYHCMELTPPYPPYIYTYYFQAHMSDGTFPSSSDFLAKVNDTALTPTYTITLYYDRVERH